MTNSTAPTMFTAERTAAMRTSPAPTEPSLGDLFTDLTGDMSELIRQEIRLAKTETEEKLRTATRSLISVLAGAILGYAGLIVLLFAAAAGLSLFMDLWLAHTIVGALVVLIGVILLMSGRNALKQISLTPDKTLETLKNDARWAKEQVS